MRCLLHFSSRELEPEENLRVHQLAFFSPPLVDILTGHQSAAVEFEEEVLDLEWFCILPFKMYSCTLKACIFIT